MLVCGLVAAALGFAAFRVLDEPSGVSAAKDRSVQSRLREALQAEKTYFVANNKYADAAKMRAADPTFDWGTSIKVVVGNVHGKDRRVVCLSERSSSGKTFSIGDVAGGDLAGLYFGGSISASRRARRWSRRKSSPNSEAPGSKPNARQPRKTRTPTSRTR
jgi:hypothetical protein